MLLEILYCVVLFVIIWSLISNACWSIGTFEVDIDSDCKMLIDIDLVIRLLCNVLSGFTMIIVEF